MKTFVEFVLLIVLAGILLRGGYELAGSVAGAWRNRTSRKPHLCADEVRVVATSSAPGRAAISWPDGRTVHGVRSAYLDIDAQRGTACGLELSIVHADAVAVPHFSIRDPRTGFLRTVRRIEYIDGSEFVWHEPLRGTGSEAAA